MTEVYAAANGTGQGDRTHALVVGVGAYALRADNSASPAAPPIGAAARSALRVVDFLFGNAANLAKPLGTLELLVSDPAAAGAPSTYQTPDGQNLPIEPPTIANLKKAVERWFERLNEREGNAALLYAVGHGVFDDQTYLLAEDFGTSTTKAFDNMVAVNDFYVGMMRCKARSQLFLVDCCKEINDDALRQLGGVRGEAFVSVDGGGIRESERALLTAVSTGQLANASASGLTYFCEALLAAMRGEAAVSGSERGSWAVTAVSLYNALLDLQRRIAGGTLNTVPDAALSGALEVLRLASPPVVEVEFLTDPEIAVYDAEIRILDGHHAPVIPPWVKPSTHSVRGRIAAKHGYRACARFDPGAKWRDADIGFSVWPRMHPVAIPVS